MSSTTRSQVINIRSVLQSFGIALQLTEKTVAHTIACACVRVRVLDRPLLRMHGTRTLTLRDCESLSSSHPQMGVGLWRARTGGKPRTARGRRRQRRFPPNRGTAKSLRHVFVSRRESPTESPVLAINAAALSPGGRRRQGNGAFSAKVSRGRGL